MFTNIEFLHNFHKFISAQQVQSFLKPAEQVWIDIFVDFDATLKLYFPKPVLCELWIYVAKDDNSKEWICLGIDLDNM